MLIEPGDNDYQLELFVPAASVLTVFDHGGSDCFTVLGSYSMAVQVDLAYLLDYGTGAACAGMAWYCGLDGIGHQMIVLGLVENAFGGPGTEVISGNELDNVLSGDTQIDGPGSADTLQGRDGNDTLLGGAGADFLGGDAGDDDLWGHLGADTLLGGMGRDTLTGGAGADLIDGGGDAGDLASYQTSGAGVRITLHAGGAATASGGDAEGDVLLGVTGIAGSALRDILVDGTKTDLPQRGNANLFLGEGGRDLLALGGGDDTALGGAGNDLVKGEGGADDLQGGTGNDKVLGGAGADRLSGGTGADKFIFLRPADSGTQPETCDVIVDFSPTQGDRINLAALDADWGRSGNQDFHLVAGEFSGQAGELVQLQDGPDLLLLADCNGDSLADFALRLQGVTLLEAGVLLL